MSLEQNLQDHEEQLDALLKSANRYVGALKAWKTACSVGHINNLQKSAQLAQDLSQQLPNATEEIQIAWTFDTKEYLASGEWRRELESLVAERFGLRVQAEDENLISSPVTVRALPERQALMVGKIAFQTLRPKVIGAELKRLRDRTASANSQEFLESLYNACVHLSDKTDPHAKFIDIYNLFCLTPGYKKENSPAAFGQQIYALHRSDLRATKAGKKMEIEFATGSYKEKEVFIVLSEDARPLRYFSLFFK